MSSMIDRQTFHSLAVRAVVTLLSFTAAPSCAVGQPSAAVAAFDSYSQAVEMRLEKQLRSHDGCALLSREVEFKARRGEFVVEQLTPAGNIAAGAMLHHWRGSAFITGASAADFRRLMKDFDAYPLHYRPQVLRARVLTRQGDRFQVVMRVRQHHVLTVVMDSTYDVTFGELDPHCGYSRSRSTQISEIDSAGTAGERTLGAREEHGFLWRLNTYWSYAERDGGLEITIESISLTRDIPTGLGWMIGPFVQSIPRESLEFTLRSTSDALRNQQSRFMEERR